MTTLRKVLNENGEIIRLSELKIGDVFTMYDDDIKLGPYITTTLPREVDGVWAVDGTQIEKKL